MNRRLALCAALIFLQIGASCITQAQAPDRNEIADLIANTAERLCYVTGYHGNASSAEAIGAVDLELGGLARRLVGAGLSGAGDITDEKYQNVVRRELTRTFAKTFECRQKVFNILEAKLRPTHVDKPPIP